MSHAGAAVEARREPPCDCPGTRHGSDGGRPHYRNGPDGPEPVINLDGSGPCCDHPRWPGCAECPHYSPVSRELNAMRDGRPADAPRIDQLGDDPMEIEQCQLTAFRAGDEDWWRYGAGFVAYERNELGYWAPEPEAAAGGGAGAG